MRHLHGLAIKRNAQTPLLGMSWEVDPFLSGSARLRRRGTGLNYIWPRLLRYSMVERPLDSLFIVPSDVGIYLVGRPPDCDDLSVAG